MDPIQLAAMQQMSQGAPQLGIPGMQAPMMSGGASQLFQLTDPSVGLFNRSVGMINAPGPDMMPLAGVPFQNFGMPGMLAGMAGNIALSGMLQQQGVTPMGNAGSFMQAQRTLDFQNMMGNVSGRVAQQDADSFFNTMRGGAALLGMPFDEEQQGAARDLSETIAGFGPMLGSMAPGMLDTLAGERGSIQSMSSQMMLANRYQIDPLTGRMGFDTEANEQMVNQVFDTMFADDNYTRMQGLRAGDIGQLYKELAPEGLVGPQGSRRDRAVSMLEQLREEDGAEFESILSEAGVMANPDNLQSLTPESIAKLTQTSAVSERLSKSDGSAITKQLEGYVDTIAALREVFGEAGNPNAPIPQLINGLKAFTAGQSQQFDTNQLNAVVRDMQALSQMSGKSLDQLTKSTQLAAQQGEALGIGRTFAPTAVNVGTTTGMAFQEQGGATGFGAVTREQAEARSMEFFNRGMSSQMANTLGALGRVRESGGFSDNDAGQRIEKAMDALERGDTKYTYTRDGQTVTEDVPRTEAAFRGMVSQGGVEGMNLAQFGSMLNDRTSNLRNLHSNRGLQQAAFNVQAEEVNDSIERVMQNRLMSNEQIDNANLSGKEKVRTTRSMARAANQALRDLSAQEMQNADTRNTAMAEAIMGQAAAENVDMSESEARNAATGLFGSAENVARSSGFTSMTEFKQVMGTGMTNSRRSKQAQVQARASVNESMSVLGNKGSLSQRIVTAIQKQGGRGGEADLSTLLADAFGVGNMDAAQRDISSEFKIVADRQEEVESIIAELDGATDTERPAIQGRLDKAMQQLDAAVVDAKSMSDDYGLAEVQESFDRTDFERGRAAERDIRKLRRYDRAAMLAQDSEITDEQLQEQAGSDLSEVDLKAAATSMRNAELDRVTAEAEAATLDGTGKLDKDLQELAKDLSPDAARRQLVEDRRDTVSDLDEFMKRTSGMKNLADIKSQDIQRDVLRSRRTEINATPTSEETVSRAEELFGDLGDIQDADERNDAMSTAFDNLLAENQLKQLGLLSSDGKLTSDDVSDPTLRAALAAADTPQERTQIAEEFIDKQGLNRFQGSEEDFESRRQASEDYLGSDAGTLSAAQQEKQLGRLSFARRQLLGDARAAERIGGQNVVDIVNQSRDAELDLQSMADRYYDGSVGNMLAAPEAFNKDKLDNLREDFKDLSDSAKKDIAEDLGKDADSLTLGDFRAHQDVKMRGLVGQMGDAVDAMEGAVDPELEAERYGVSTDALKAIKNLKTSRVLANSDGSGMSQTEYEAYIKSDADSATAAGVEATILSDEEVKEREQEIEAADRAEKLERQLKQLDVALVQTPHDLELQEDRKLKQASLDIARKQVGTTPVEQIRGELTEHRRASGLQQSRLKYQRHRNKALGELRKQHPEMSESELSDRLDSVEGEMEKSSEEGISELEDLRELDLQGRQAETVTRLAEHLGLDETGDAGDSTTARLAITPVDPNDEDSKRSQALLLRNLDMVADIGELSGESSVRKLDSLTDQFAESKTSAEKRELAARYGMSGDQLEVLMAETEHLDLANTELSGMEDDDIAELVGEAMKRNKGRNIEKEVADERSRTLELAGSIEITGHVVQGEGTVDEVQGEMRA